MRAAQYFILTISFSILVACSSIGNQLSDIVFIPNANSNQRSEQLIEVELAFSENAPAEDAPLVESDDDKLIATGGRSVAATIADIAISQIGKALTEEAKRYTATYSAEAAHDQFYFYAAPTREAKHIDRATLLRPKSDIRFAGFRFVRRIEKPGDDRGEIAVAICAVTLPSPDDLTFILIPISYDLRYSKAKLIAFDFLSPFGVDILNPWEIVTDPLMGGGYKLPPADNDLDLTMAVTFEYLHFVDGYELTHTTAGPNTFDLKSARVMGRPSKGDSAERGVEYFPAFKSFLDAKGDGYRLGCDEDTATKDIAVLHDKLMALPLGDLDKLRLSSGAKVFPAAPRVLGEDGGNANFTIKVAVTEFDNYGARINELNEAFDENKDSIQQKITDFLDDK